MTFRIHIDFYNYMWAVYLIVVTFHSIAITCVSFLEIDFLFHLGIGNNGEILPTLVREETCGLVALFLLIRESFQIFKTESHAFSNKSAYREVHHTMSLGIQCDVFTIVRELNLIANASRHLLDFFDDIVCDFLARISHHLFFMLQLFTEILCQLLPIYFTARWVRLYFHVLRQCDAFYFFP